MERRSKAALTAALLSATFAERLTGFSPPWAFFNPALFALFLAMYGSGVNLSREFVVRRGKGPATLVALGLAYAVFEEALVLRTWFDPDSPNVRLVGDYGRFGATNVVWAVWVTPWLALLAIWIPCLATDLLFPDLRNEPYSRTAA